MGSPTYGLDTVRGLAFRGVQETARKVEEAGHRAARGAELAALYGAFAITLGAMTVIVVLSKVSERFTRP